jgi:hypothetical protein
MINRDQKVNTKTKSALKGRRILLASMANSLLEFGNGEEKTRACAMPANQWTHDLG